MLKYQRLRHYMFIFRGKFPKERSYSSSSHNNLIESYHGQGEGHEADTYYGCGNFFNLHRMLLEDELGSSVFYNNSYEAFSRKKNK